MEFVKTNGLKIKLSKHQQTLISSKETISKHINNSNILAFDILDDGKLVGFAMLREFAKGKFFLWDFAIDKLYQGKGIGTRALAELIDFIKQNYHCTQLTTTYKWGNDIAKHLYENAGFKETDIVDEEDVHEVNMSLEL